MEKSQKNKHPLLTTIQKLSNELRKKTAKTKIKRNTPAHNAKAAHSSSLIALQKPVGKKKSKEIGQGTQPDSEKTLKKQTYKAKRNHSLEGNFNDESIHQKKPKRNNSLVEIESEQENWDPCKVPYTPALVVKLFSKSLTFYEQNEILTFRNVFYIAHEVNKLDANRKLVNYGFDDERNDYILVKNDHINYRFEILEILGRGSYGQVIKAYDHKEKKLVAIKIIRNLDCIIHQAKIEIQILYKLLQSDEGHDKVIQIIEHFLFRNHICLVFDLLDLNLYQYLKIRASNPLSSNTIRNFTEQILSGIKFFHSLNILHSDLKPENIMLTEDKTSVKIIDFGSGCFSHKKVFTYIQSRFYRAPEVILELGYNEKIDMWSLGCVIAELFIGKPLFSGRDEIDQFLCITECLGIPPVFMLEMSAKKFAIVEALKKHPNLSLLKAKGSGTKTLKNLLVGVDPVIIHFIQSKT
jgi:dual specificity tyrosine-phosphorylation-regulated kinase 2/3/4